MPKTVITDELYQYCLDKGVREHPALVSLRQQTQAQLKNSQMLISPEHGAFLAMLIKLMNVNSYLEVGVFTGYSTLWAALSLPETGKIVALDISAEHKVMAESAWDAAKIRDKIEYIISPAKESMQSLIAKGESFDLVFIDANKSQYLEYYELALQLVSSGGLIMIDNVLMYGQVLENTPAKTYIKTLQKLNDLIKEDPRVDICMLPFGDGITLARKK
ncbi:O-methyltransferase [Aquella oligotrophica]|uniref:SAM-dependent methyltransferase n=1 Tax=Aquella oligotrophica TaxID=2067065 RepID=A0A2I7N4Y7_9NEIS|nr:class I SAM-dependent methyltransferase [Aquella oligotrophica]AUR51520.1 SAM-dependent methyltransferase [Aquella oligotrophica]